MKIVFLLTYMMVYLIAISPSIYISYVLYEIYDKENVGSRLGIKMDRCIGILVSYYVVLFILFLFHYLDNVVKII